MILRDRKKYYKSIAYTALLLALSSALSLLEASFIPSSVPGVKLGLANICVFAAFIFVSKGAALFISFLRPALTFILFSNPYSFAISLCGSIFSYLALLIFAGTKDKVFSFVGISAISAAAHICGQFLAAHLLISSAVWTYFPLSFALSVLCGVFTGIIMNVFFGRFFKALNVKEKK